MFIVMFVSFVLQHAAVFNSVASEVRAELAPVLSFVERLQAHTPAGATVSPSSGIAPGASTGASAVDETPADPASEECGCRLEDPSATCVMK